MKLKVRIGRLFGMRVYVHASFAILVAYYMWGFVLDDVMIGTAVVASIVMHELAHAVAGRIVGMVPVCITLHGLGACVRFRRKVGDGWRDALVVFAGPCMNFVLAAAAWCVFLLSRSGFPVVRETAVGACVVNLFLGVFNLLPAYPLDGGRLLRWVMSCVMNRRAASLSLLWAGVLSSVAYIGWGVYNLVEYGDAVCFVVSLLVGAGVVFACWLECDTRAD